jgi:hypothetical protein
VYLAQSSLRALQLVQHQLQLEQQSQSLLGLNSFINPKHIKKPLIIQGLFYATRL